MDLTTCLGLAALCFIALALVGDISATRQMAMHRYRSVALVEALRGMRMVSLGPLAGLALLSSTASRDALVLVLLVLFAASLLALVTHRLEAVSGNMSGYALGGVVPWSIVGLLALDSPWLAVPGIPVLAFGSASTVALLLTAVGYLAVARLRVAQDMIRWRD